MGLSIEELDLQSADYLPAREVMGMMGGGGGSGLRNFFAQNGLVNVGVNVQDVDVIDDVTANVLSVVAGGH